jgi:hypothetical protein
LAVVTLFSSLSLGFPLLPIPFGYALISVSPLDESPLMSQGLALTETVPSGTVVAETSVGEPLLGPSIGGDLPPLENDNTHVSFFY